MKNNIHIFLIGMMGSGKSSIASKLSQQLNIPYIDTDTDLTSIFNTDTVTFPVLVTVNV